MVDGRMTFLREISLDGGGNVTPVTKAEQNCRGGGILLEVGVC
jgi:hypothetical protein